MESTWLVLGALAFGLVVGAGFVFILYRAVRRGHRAAQVVAPTVPDGIDQVLEVLESGGIVLDPSGNVLRASPEALAMGLVRNQTLVHPEIAELAASARRGGEPIADELTITRGPFGDATVRLRVRAARLGTRYVLVLAEDRTEAHRLDEVRRDFVANISHELKTPIASVSLLAEAIEQAADEPVQVRRFASRLGVESHRLAHITSEVIELSRLQARDALRPPTLLDVDDVVAAAVEQNRIVAQSRSVDVAVRAKSHAQIYGDRPLLVVAVHNLISNAIAYSKEGGRVGVGVAVRQGIVEIAVTDQGIGIAEDDLDRVFERFYRVDTARARNTGGSGLGLAIVKHTVQNHGGEVRVWSQPGRGSTFTIRLPLAEPPLPPAETTDPRAGDAVAAETPTTPPTPVDAAATATPRGDRP